MMKRMKLACSNDFNGLGGVAGLVGCRFGVVEEIGWRMSGWYI